MALLDAFRRQHTQILAIVRDMIELAEDELTAETATRHRALLSTLSGTLGVHLAMEDGSLYPRLTEDGDPDVRAMAARYEREMRGLAGEFRAHLERWSSARAIRQEPERFMAETKQIGAALARRIAFEDAELYPALERLGA